MLVLLILVAIVDALLGVLLVAVSGFVLGPGPESSNGDPAAVACWTTAPIGIAAPVAGFILRAQTQGRDGRPRRVGTARGGVFLTSGLYHAY
jgi:hypothetical protein